MKPVLALLVLLTLTGVPEPAGAQFPVTSFTIPDRGGVSLTTSGAAGDAVSGYGNISAGSGSTMPSALAIIGYRPHGVLVSEASVPATPLLQTGRIYAEINGKVNTGLAIANPNNQPAIISFYFSGSLPFTGTQQSFGNGSTTIPANGQLTAFLDQPPFNGTIPFGTFTFTSTRPVAAVALRGLTNERQEFLMTTLPVIDLSAASTGSSAVVAPHFADGGGWTTQVLLVNPSDSLLRGFLTFQDQAGNAISTFNYIVFPRDSSSYSKSTSGTSPTIQSGSVLIAPVPSVGGPAPVALSVFSYRSGGVTVTETGVPSLGEGNAFRLYVEASGDFDNSVAGSIGTGVAIVNRSTAPARVTVEWSRLDGSSIGAVGTIDLPAGGQTAKFLNQISGLESLPLPFQGILRVSSPSRISVVGLRGRYNERREFLITATPPVVETAPPGVTDLYFPDFVDAGGYTTQFIIFNGSSAPQLSGALSLFSQTGVPVNLLLQ